MILSLEPTNACNLKCLHCLRDKLEDRKAIPLDLVRGILREAKSYGFSYIAITGGEPTLHPHLDELLDMIVREGFRFHIITNGFQFRTKVLPILLKPHIRRQLHHIAISLDGATAKTHDAIRGQGAFTAAMEMAALCKLKGLPFNLITVINNLNKAELTDIALMGSGLDAIFHLFSPLQITPLAAQQRIVPSPTEVKSIISFVSRTLFKALKMPITIGAGAHCGAALFDCPVTKGDHMNVDYQGNAIFCCTLSHPADDSRPDEPGKEVLADLKRESLGTAIVRQKLMVARMIRSRLRAAESRALTELDYFPCYWCFKRFGKLGWLKNYPDSPWAEAVYAGENGGHAKLVASGVN